MKKESLAEKAARKSFESAAIQKSWNVHIQAFGPILEPAFAENYRARIDLTAALNYVSNYNLKKGLQKLQGMESACVTDADKAAWLFCMGLCFEMANVTEEMVAYYQEAGRYGHKFYLPYLKIAKAAHNDAVFEIAEENYKTAIQCLVEGETDEQKRTILGAVYTNYASCLTMMHRYDEAGEALQNAKEFLPEQKGRVATEAILEAAVGNCDKAHEYTEMVAKEVPQVYEATKKTVCDILEGKHPHFHKVALPEESINVFWNWFVNHEESFRKQIEAKEYEAVFGTVQSKLKEVFPFVERDLDFGIEPRDAFYQITFADYYMVSLEEGYKELIKAVPTSLTEHWGFDTAR